MRSVAPHIEDRGIDEIYIDLTELVESSAADGSPDPWARARVVATDIQRAVREAPLDPEWIEATLNSLEHLVLAGDEANLAQRVVEMITAPGGDAAAVG